MPQHLIAGSARIALFVHRFAGAALDLLFPPCCHACLAALPAGTGVGLCDECRTRVRFITGPLCCRCGLPLPGVTGDLFRHCATCVRQPPSFDTARSLVLYEPPVSTLLQHLKFKGDTGAARVLATLGRVDGPDCDLIIPVPLHGARLRARGFNQSLILARWFFRDKRERIIPDLLIRQKKTIAQTGLTGHQRRRNLFDAFNLVRPADISGQVVCLVDDILTTGSTVQECSKILKKSGAAAVHVWTVARVLPLVAR